MIYLACAYLLYNDSIEFIRPSTIEIQTWIFLRSPGFFFWTSYFLLASLIIIICSVASPSLMYNNWYATMYLFLLAYFKKGIYWNAINKKSETYQVTQGNVILLGSYIMKILSMTILSITKNIYVFTSI